jgi:hypothetical protein
VHVVNKNFSGGRRPGSGTLNHDEAESIAVRGLVFLSGDNSRMARFLGLTGLAPDELRRSARSPWFMAAVLDHLMSDESLLLVFCAENDIDPALVAPARRALAPEPDEAL